MLPTKNTWKGILMLQIQLAQGVMRKIGLASYKKKLLAQHLKNNEKVLKGQQ